MKPFPSGSGLDLAEDAAADALPLPLGPGEHAFHLTHRVGMALQRAATDSSIPVSGDPDRDGRLGHLLDGEVVAGLRRQKVRAGSCSAPRSACEPHPARTLDGEGDGQDTPTTFGNLEEVAVGGRRVGDDGPAKIYRYQIEGLNNEYTESYNPELIRSLLQETICIITKVR